MGERSRIIPGVTLEGVTRGGGSEQIEWYRNGPLLLERNYTLYTPGRAQTSYLAGRHVFASAPTLPTGSADSDSTVRAAGTTAVANSVPTSSSVSLITSAGELAADGLPNPAEFKRWESSARGFLRYAGRQHLAVQFAYIPLILDIRNWAKQVVKSDEILQRARERKSHRIVRVGYTFPTKTSSDTTFGAVNARIWTSGTSTGNYARGGSSVSTTAKTWFEGSYLNLMPVSPSQYSASEDFALRARYLLGLDLNPARLWELAPWSWAVDWVTNFGDVLTSVSNTLSDGMVMRNGFVMHHYRREAMYGATSAHMSGGGSIARFTPASTIKVSETKKRFVSVPYFGFGSVGELSPRQLSILAALGISRAV